MLSARPWKLKKPISGLNEIFKYRYFGFWENESDKRSNQKSVSR